MKTDNNSKNQSSGQTAFWQRVKRKIISPWFFTILLLMLVFMIIEGIYDVVEISLGQVLTLTNSIRPQTGPVWQREINDEVAVQQLETLIQESPPEKIKLVQFQNFDALIEALNKSEEIRIPKNNFLNLYINLPYDYAQEIIPPYDLLALIDEESWQQCAFSRETTELRIYLLDGENQLIRDYYAPLRFNIDSENMAIPVGSLLDEIEEFRNRVISKADFLKAFNSLPVTTKTFIMNNPIQLIRWRDALKKVAISRYVIDGTVTIGFQIQTGVTKSIVRYQASEIAASRLVQRVNEIITDKFIAMPERKIKSSENEENF